ncbi:MAG: hypothetical protein AAGA57_07230 [Planctomycetota bacterium]
MPSRTASALALVAAAGFGLSIAGCDNSSPSTPENTPEASTPDTPEVPDAATQPGTQPAGVPATQPGG